MTLLKIEHFSFAYPKQENCLTTIDLTLSAGSFTVLFGRSGSGKTTLLRQLVPALAPFGESTGTILFKDSDIKSLTLRQQTEAIGFVMQHPENQLVTDKVWHELAFGLESLGLDFATIRLRVAEMASFFGIQNWFHKDTSELSGGQKQLLNLASVMILQPQLLILDEPTAQLDPLTAAEFFQTLKKINQELGTTILISEHRLEEVLPLADQVCLLEAGCVKAVGTPQAVAAQLQKTADPLFAAMPAPVRIYGAFAAIKEQVPLTIREGRSWLAAESPQPHKLPQPKEPAFKEPFLQARDLWFRYDRHSPDIVKGLDLTVNRGEFFGLVGGNGTGKSTALSLLSRLRQPYRGTVRLAGKPLNKYGKKELYHHLIGLLPQDPQTLFVKKTVLEDLYEIIDGKKKRSTAAYPLKMAKEEAISGMAEATHLTHLLQRHPYDLSGGEQQRLALAKVLLLRPQLLLLDEPTKGLDEFSKRELGEILAALKAQGVTLIMVSHDIEFVAEYADRVGLFFEGGLAAVAATRPFFAGNNFYTTAANRMAREFFPNAITAAEVCACLDAAKNS